MQIESTEDVRVTVVDILKAASQLHTCPIRCAAGYRVGQASNETCRVPTAALLEETRRQIISNRSKHCKYLSSLSSVMTNIEHCCVYVVTWIISGRHQARSASFAIDRLVRASCACPSRYVPKVQYGTKYVPMRTCVHRRVLQRRSRYSFVSVMTSCHICLMV